MSRFRGNTQKPDAADKQLEIFKFKYLTKAQSRSVRLSSTGIQPRHCENGVFLFKVNYMNKISNEFPFIYLGHGELDSFQLDKREECFLWLKEPVKPELRKDIMRSCPYPLAGFFYWSDFFLQFGSGGDTYDVDIMSKYASDELNKIMDGVTETEPEFWESDKFRAMYQQAANLFSADLDRWVTEVNKIVPLAFFIGPNRAKKNDPWNKWSHEHLPDMALNHILEFSENQYDLLNKNYPETNNDADIIEIKGIDAMVGIMHSVKIKHIFGYIVKTLLKEYLYETGEKSYKNINDLADLVNIIYKADEIYEPFSTLSYSDSDIKHHASLIEYAVKNLDKPAGVSFISKLKPYTQLAFYAAYNRTVLLILDKADPITFLKELLKAQPESRKNVLASMLIFMANNIVKVGPAYGNKYDLTYAAIAGQIMELCFAYPNVTEEAYINSAFFYDKLKDFEKMLDLSIKGAEKFPDSTTINANILYAAQKLGRMDIANEYAGKTEDLSMKDPALLLNQVYNLVQNGENEKAKNMVHTYISKGGKLTPELLGNMMYLYIVNSDDDCKRDTYLAALLNFVSVTGNKKFKTNPDLICNGTIVFNNLKRYEDSETLLSAFKENGGVMTAGLYNQAMFSSIAMKNKKKIESSLNDFLKVYEKHKNFFDNHAYNFATVSNCYALELNEKKTLEYLKLAKDKGFDISYVKEEKDYEFLAKNKKFQKLFY